jgi:alkanesulfonate monooxygenase SsuD/methylene tetrahydromethanopterin reductase-like flavin-dependent oxidoreductase (luciferase family)
MEEQVELLRRLWREPLLEYTGKFHRIERAGILPLPARAIPIWYGAFAPVALERAVRTGDGVFFASTPSRVRALWDGVREDLRKSGRQLSTFGSEASVDFSDGPDRWAREVELWREVGGTHLSLRAMDTAAELMGARRMGYRGPSDYIDALRKFRDAIGFGC